MDVVPFLKDAQEAARISLTRTTGKRFRFEPGQTTLKREFLISHLRGELSAAERILQVADSGTLENIDDLRAALHVFCVDVHNKVVGFIGGGKEIEVEFYTDQYLQ